MNRHHQSITIQEASLASPTLARLAQLGRESTRHLDAVKPLLPDQIRPFVKAGPIDKSVWCLLADNAAVAAKLRHLLPRMQAELLARGVEVTSIRIRVAGSR